MNISIQGRRRQGAAAWGQQLDIISRQQWGTRRTGGSCPLPALRAFTHRSGGRRTRPGAITDRTFRADGSIVKRQDRRFLARRRRWFRSASQIGSRSNNSVEHPSRRSRCRGRNEVGHFEPGGFDPSAGETPVLAGNWQARLRQSRSARTFPRTMPDWTYHTLIKPVLWRMDPDAARRLAVRSLALIAKLPGGTQLVDFLGHMSPDRRLRVNVGTVPWGGPVGLRAFVDPGGEARAALERFGCGFITVGPVGEATVIGGRWRHADKGFTTNGPEPIIAVDEILPRLERRSGVPIVARIAPLPPEACGRIGELLAPRVQALVVPVEGTDDLARVNAIVGSRGKILVMASVAPSQSKLIELARESVERGASGIWLPGDVRRGEGGERGFYAGHAPAAAVSALRRALGPHVLIISGGVFEPADARELLAARADLVAVEAGLAHGGPGLVKRTNEALLTERWPRRVAGVPGPEAARHAWFWGWLLGLAMLGGGILAVIFSSTRVVLPYDEVYCGITRSEFSRINPRLLAFMAHDRMTLAGVMIGLGWFYTSLGWHGLRRGAHWAKVVLVSSGSAGFFSFFLFLGFGYFEPFHAFVSAALLPLTLMCLHSPLGVRYVPPVAEWRVGRAWRRGQWGQLLFVTLGAGLLGAGLVISGVGCGPVFVAADLEFLGTTVSRLQQANDRLVPLVAHDRASLGGMLISSGLAVGLTALWGFRAGERWIWWALAISGNIAFALAIGVHFAVQYHSLEHLIPAVLGWVLWWVALGLSHEWLTRQSVQ